MLSHKLGHINSHLNVTELTPGPCSQISTETRPTKILISADTDDNASVDTKDNLCNPEKPPPNFSPPPNFKWAFLHGFWTLVPTIFSIELENRPHLDKDSSPPEHLDQWKEDNHGSDVLPEVHPDPVIQCSGESEPDRGSEESLDIADSESDFEQKINRILAGEPVDNSHCARRSERRKKPCSKWSEESGFLPQPPKSSKKKGNASSTPDEAPALKKAKLDDPMAKVKRSLDFLTSREVEQVDPPLCSVAPSETEI